MAAGDVKVALSNSRGLACNVFDGVDDYVEIPHNANQLGVNLPNGFTISAWINPRSGGETTGKILDKSTSTTSANGFHFHVDSNRLSININAGTTRSSAVSSIPYGNWIYVLVTVNSSSIANFYVNGVLSGTANQDLVQPISAITTTNAMRIGNRATATDRTFDGGIRAVKMWNRVLTQDEITADYKGHNPAPANQILNVPLGGNYANGTNSGSIPAIVDDVTAVAIKAQRVGANDKYMVYKGGGNQVGSVAIEA